MTAALGSLPLGGTADGKAWCRKALHPADHEIMATRYPGGSQVPTVSSNFTQVMELVPDPSVAGHVTSWNARIFMRQDPVMPVSVQLNTMVDDGQSTTVSFPWLNRTLTTHEVRLESRYSVPGTRAVTQAFDAFRRGKNFYRITHMGLTIEHVCSSTTNQGTVLSGQYSIEPSVTTMAGYPLQVKTTSPAAVVFGTGVDDGGHFPLQPASLTDFTLFQAPHIRHYGEGPMSEMALLQATNGYTGSARDGLYIPLKLQGCDKMVNVDKRYVLMGHDTAQAVAKQVFAQRSGSHGQTTGWPYYALYDLESGANTNPVFMYGCKECGTSISDTVIKGLDPHASLRLYLRVGIEYIPEIDTETACFARMSPLPDELAVRMYQEIACRMKDAYPRDYNDKSKLLEVINGFAKRLVPAIDKGLNFFSQIKGNPWAPAAAGLRTLTSAWLAKPQRKSGKKKIKTPRGGVDQSELKAAASASALLGGSRKRTITLSNGQKLTIERKGPKQ